MYLLTEESPFHYFSLIWLCKDDPQRHLRQLPGSEHKNGQSAEAIMGCALRLLMTLDSGDNTTLFTAFSQI